VSTADFATRLEDAIEPPLAVRVMLGVARLGEAGLRGWWSSQGMNAEVRFALAGFRRTSTAVGAPTLERRLFTDHYGFVSDYFAEALRQLRKRSFVTAIDEEFALGSHLSARDEKAVRKTVSGLLKLLHPDGRWSRAELRDYLEFALEGRRRVKEQLRKLAAYEFSKTEFTYVERDSGIEHTVDVLERGLAAPDCVEPGDPLAAPVGSVHEAPTPGTTTLELLELDEGATFEFKATLRFNLHTSKRDDALELEVSKSIAGFMNSPRGGTLLVGVVDDVSLRGADKVRGLSDDCRLTGNRGLDGFENTLMTLLGRSIGKVAAATVRVTFETFGDHDVCRIDAPASPAPVYVKWKDNELFFVRLGNSTRQFKIGEAIEYIRVRFG